MFNICSFIKKKINLRINKNKLIKNTSIVFDNIIYQCYTYNGQKHKEDGPAVIQYFISCDDSISLVNKTYYRFDKMHREDGPAYEDWYRYSNGKNLCLQQWFINGELHNTSGPAVIKYDYNGNVLATAYYINGKKYEDEFEFIIASQLYKIKKGKVVKKD